MIDKINEVIDAVNALLKEHEYLSEAQKQTQTKNSNATRNSKSE